jgi:hypothetical protein
MILLVMTGLLAIEEMLDEFRTDLTRIYKFNSVDSIYTTPPTATPSPLSAATNPSSLSSQSPVDLVLSVTSMPFHLEGRKDQ